ncbi:hypothetical protein TBLA_0J00750 [Henningerozyma blattae CBS 6284]|uniref:ATP synthase subunit K, mitochondrial n=1 Tax=Henningerozyma blattae (strain ATCC 34711 / CBS 6284 / DSM 70876 / NBRC 10599 / NRRL Y-10934 / UCD 77-7) TaxID=1071380 RepID=I2H9M1_HENB6|nr:hypothetical protein TBLA_0J00750 [Tetrapisispora blattae CBS 6284]CCH63073.1 hypothetical protein TBLA_0J00750 [Tetrapisispora blattae CBS 6284]
MGASYQIFGKAVPTHYMAIATLATAGAIGGWAASGPKKPTDTTTSSASPKEDDLDIEKLISDFVKDQDNGSSTATK